MIYQARSPKFFPKIIIFHQILIFKANLGGIVRSRSERYNMEVILV